MSPLHWIFPLAAWAAAAAPPAKPEPLAIESRSGQFTVTGPREIVPSPGYLNSAQRTNFLLLDQPRLAVLCERVKLALLKELQSDDRWKGRILVNLYRAGEPGEPVFVKAQYTPGGWFYQLNVPSEAEPARLVRVLVAVLLQEMADRAAGPRPAELPPWLAPGLAAQLETVSGASFRLDDQTRIIRIERHVDPVAEMRRRMGNELPLSVDELNWPTEAHLADPPLGYYETCAQLFVVELLRLPGGAECLRSMLERAAQHLNWQTAFLAAFSRHFKTLRDTDKWWALQTAVFAGRDPAKTYTLKESWQKLEEVLACPVTLSGPSDKTPQRGMVNLQTVINQWDYPRQRPLLRQKVVQLEALRLRIAPQLLRLTDDYRNTLSAYLSRRDKAGYAPETRGAIPDSPRLLARKTVAQLDALDLKRADLKASGAAVGEMTNGR